MMKATIEIEMEIDGKISDERLKEVIKNDIMTPGPIISEECGDGDAYFIFVSVVEVKEITR